MKKGILDQFASDAINAPAVVTGGCGKGGGSHKKSRGSHKKSGKSGHGCGCK